MFPGPFAFQTLRGRGVAAAICASLVLTWLVATAHDAPPLAAPAESSARPALILFPLLTDPLLWPHWLHR